MSSLSSMNAIQLIKGGKEIILVQPGLGSGPRWELAVHGSCGCKAQRPACLGGCRRSVSAVNLIKVAEGGSPAVNRCPSQWSRLQSSDSSLHVLLLFVHPLVSVSLLHLPSPPLLGERRPPTPLQSVFPDLHRASNTS